MPKKIRICAVQFKVKKSFDDNINRVENFFRIANKKNCDIICFPEIFLSGPFDKLKYSNDSIIKSKRIFSGLSKKYGLFSIMVSIAERIGETYYNISYFFDDSGDILGSYRKNHLVLKSEGESMTAGDDVNVFRTKIGNIGIEICRDLLYPEITRKLMLKGADIVFCPSFWCSISSSYDWIYNHKYFKDIAPREVDHLVSSRSIESELFFVYVNAAGAFNYKKTRNILLGRTQIGSPFYGTTAIMEHNKEGVLIADADLKVSSDARKVYKIERDLKNYYR